jgi:hypothetical protein
MRFIPCSIYANHPVVASIPFQCLIMVSAEPAHWVCSGLSLHCAAVATPAAAKVTLPAHSSENQAAFWSSAHVLAMFGNRSARQPSRRHVGAAARLRGASEMRRSRRSTVCVRVHRAQALVRHICCNMTRWLVQNCRCQCIVQRCRPRDGRATFHWHASPRNNVGCMACGRQA